MAMNTTYMRQTSSGVNPEQIHSFLKDKQAWENAIAMYEGPDPLDHWYNYICWFENHIHGDPENKYRETLERCLTVYEHNNFYKQDARMVRLWLKYIDMQPNPLHFYQVLFQRGTGRQVSAFYIGWANYYDSVRAYNEAESVFNLGFHEKAQSYAELHHAHSKFMYARSGALSAAGTATATAVVPAVPPPAPSADTQLQIDKPVQPQAHQQPQQRQVHFQQQQNPTQVPPPPPSPQQQHAHAQAQAQIYRQQQQIYQQQLQANTAQQQQQQSAPQQYQPQTTHQQQDYSQQPQQQQQQQPLPPPPHLHPQLQQQQQSEEHTNQPHFQQHPSHQPQPQQPFTQQAYVQQQPLQQQQMGYQQPATQAPAATTQQQQQERQLGNGTSHHYRPPPQLQQNQALSKLQASSAEPSIESIRLSRNFATYARNNNETWTPALTLEEPEDPCRRCHYSKHLVYPTGAGIEYSPEELLARKYEKILEVKSQQRAAASALAQLQASAWVKQEQPAAPQMYNAFEEQQHHQQQQHTEQQIMYAKTVSAHESHNNNGSSSFDDEEDDAVPADEDLDNDDADEEEDYDEDKEEDEEGDDDEEDEGADVAESNKQQRTTTYCDDDQVEASTIRFSMQTAEQGVQNKTIKIKFKKERSIGNEARNGSAYSAYTIESIYQQDIPASPQTDNGRQRNGHSFHPYLLGQTSTPKANSQQQLQQQQLNGCLSSKRSKSKLKRVQNKLYPAVLASNSNSSTNEQPALEQSVATPASESNATTPRSTLQNATFNDNANYSFSSATGLDNSNCSIATAVGRLNFRDATSGAGSHYNNNNTINNNNNNNSTVVADFSTYQENSYFATQHDTEAQERRRTKALETIERHLAKEAIDPFNSELCRAFLTKLDFPGAEEDTHANYKIIQTPLPKIANTRTLSLPDGMQFNMDKEVGRGSYGSVYKATDVRSGNVVALKFQKPPNSWEIYICDQVLKRIKEPSVLPGLMDISTAIIAPNASLIATEFSPFGSLLDINNKIRQATTKVMHESLVMHFSAQICNIIYHLHMQKIIHADIKPDNFLLMRVPSTDLGIPSLRLIDFGCAIDMTLFPDPDAMKFRKVIQTDGFTCIEMQEGRPWSYETDLFCIASTVHVMLFGEYMQLQHRTGAWDIRQKLPRYLKKHVWNKFFGDVLNIEAGKLPNLLAMRNVFEEEAFRMDSELQKQIRALSHILLRR